MRDIERERERERGKDTGRGRSRLHAGSLMWDSIPGLQDRPGLKAGAKLLSHPGIPYIYILAISPLLVWLVFCL